MDEYIDGSVNPLALLGGPSVISRVVPNYKRNNSQNNNNNGYGDFTNAAINAAAAVVSPAALGTVGARAAKTAGLAEAAKRLGAAGALGASIPQRFMPLGSLANPYQLPEVTVYGDEPYGANIQDERIYNAGQLPDVEMRADPSTGRTMGYYFPNSIGEPLESWVPWVERLHRNSKVNWMSEKTLNKDIYGNKIEE